MEEDKKVDIKVNGSTKDRIKSYGLTEDETYENILVRLLNYAEAHGWECLRSSQTQLFILVKLLNHGIMS